MANASKDNRSGHPAYVWLAGVQLFKIAAFATTSVRRGGKAVLVK